MIVTLPGRSGRRTAPDVVVGWCVRMDWPDGTHSLTLFRPTQAAATDRLPGLRRYWAPGPVRPRRYRVVQVSHHDWRLHGRRPRCTAPDCPGGDG